MMLIRRGSSLGACLLLLPSYYRCRMEKGGETGPLAALSAAGMAVWIS